MNSDQTYPNKIRASEQQDGAQLKNVYRGGGGVRFLSARRGFQDVSNSPGHILPYVNHGAHVIFLPKFSCDTTDMQLNFVKLTEI